MEISEIMAAFAAKLGLEGLSPDGDGVYHLGIDGMEVHLMEVAESASLVTWGSVGETPPEYCDRLLYRTMLEAMFMGSATGGSSFSIDRESGEICLQRLDPLSTLDSDAFWKMLERFVNILAEWREIVSKYGEAAPDRAREERDGQDETRRIGLGQAEGILV